MGLYNVRLDWENALTFCWYDFSLTLFIALASSHVVCVMFVPIFAHGAVFGGAERVSARLWELGRLL